MSEFHLAAQKELAAALRLVNSEEAVGGTGREMMKSHLGRTLSSSDALRLPARCRVSREIGLRGE
jgi:hypothetical protein